MPVLNVADAAKVEAAAARKAEADAKSEVTVERVQHLQEETALEARNREDRQMLGIAHKEYPRLTAEWQRSRDQRDAAFLERDSALSSASVLQAALDTSRECCRQLCEDKAGLVAQVEDLLNKAQEREGKVEYVGSLKRKIRSLEVDLEAHSFCHMYMYTP